MPFGISIAGKESHMLQWIALQPPDSYQMHVAGAIVLSLFGVYLYDLQKKITYKYKKPFWWLAWAIPMGFAVFYYGNFLFSFITDPIYNGLVDSKKLRIAHYIAPIIPIVFFVITYFVERAIEKQRENLDY